MIQLDLSQSAIMNLRFAYSPLLELVISYRLLHGKSKSTMYSNWIEEARQTTSDVQYPYLHELLFPPNPVKVGSYIPDFLTPTPTFPVRDIEVEFEQLASLAPDVIREYVQVLIAHAEPSEILCEFVSHPYESIQTLILELRDYWQRTLAHHWNRMMAVLENDILYHSRVMTLHGLEEMFPTLDQVVEYDAGSIFVNKPKGDCDPERENILLQAKRWQYDVNSEQFQLVPVIFAANHVFHQVVEPWHPMLLYTPRGAGLWNYETPEPSHALEITLGAGKSRILLALETPFSTGELARKLSLTSGAVSQQLGKLHQAGLVESHRSGKHVFYRLTDRGLTLVDLFN